MIPINPRLGTVICRSTPTGRIDYTNDAAHMRLMVRAKTAGGKIPERCERRSTDEHAGQAAHEAQSNGEERSKWPKSMK